MIYTTSRTIQAPRSRVVELFDDPANMQKWQPGLESAQLIKGRSRQPGAETHLKFKMGKREMEMKETIELRELPDKFDCIYEANGVWNRVRNQFVDRGEQTEWTMESEFKFKGMMKLMGWIMPGAFKKQTGKNMDQFKEFVESETA